MPAVNGPLMRAPVLRLARAGWFRRIATGRVGWLVASRFVAGDDLESAIETSRALAERRCATILDHLGENVTSPAHAEEAVAAYVRALDRIEREPGLDLTISVKLTQLGLDFSTDLAVANLQRVIDASRDRVVMIDMESSAYVDRTLAVFRAVREGSDRVGVCLQACLHRTPRDVEALPEASIVRLVKGAYLEPPEVAIEDRSDVRRAFARLGATLLARGHTVHVATHDPELLEGASRPRRADGDVVEARRPPVPPRRPARPADPLRERGLPGHRLRAVRHRVVSLPHSTPGRAPCQYVVLPVEPRAGSALTVGAGPMGSRRR